MSAKHWSITTSSCGVAVGLYFLLRPYVGTETVKEHLGLPIYNRFDSIIKFADLPDMAKEKIAEREIERLKKDYDIEDRELFDKIKKGAVTQSNAREIKHLIKDTFSLVALKKICGETEI